MGEMPIIDREKCDNCGLCVSVCGCGALMILGGVLTAVAVDECRWCTICELVCPKEAIRCPFEIVFEEK